MRVPNPGLIGHHRFRHGLLRTVKNRVFPWLSAMGTGASVEEREVLKTSIYSAAATVLQKLDGDGDMEDRRLARDHLLEPWRCQSYAVIGVISWQKLPKHILKSTLVNFWNTAFISVWPFRLSKEILLISQSCRPNPGRRRRWGRWIPTNPYQPLYAWKATEGPRCWKRWRLASFVIILVKLPWSIGQKIVF